MIYTYYYIYMYACMYACMYVCMYVCIYVYVYICICVYTYIYIYIYIYIYTYTCICCSMYWLTLFSYCLYVVVCFVCLVLLPHRRGLIVIITMAGKLSCQRAFLSEHKPWLWDLRPST